MYLIVGLGNPERKYDKTKHNVGFDAVDEIIDEFDIPSSGISMKGMYGKGFISGEKVMVMKPLTYMNLSGHAVKAYIDYYNIDPASELIVIYDDVDLPAGQMRIRKKGSAGSHNGMKNIIQLLGDNNFVRIRVGIGPKPERWDLADYVLAPFSREDRQKIDGIIEEIPQVIKKIIEDGADLAMTAFNKKPARVLNEA
ncbi:MAG TPA: aminoacyl-tRNA hydrolase [Candidatus Alectryocaccobium stercorigallinarum]|jgi:PTH1 family peptidyl-tRNA hydrolase|nr:aminoacyl-tRNA hydrolase [Candidatus Alectryocaccobium stercorigallinarum]